MPSVGDFLKTANHDNLCVVVGLNNSTGLSIVRDLGSHKINVIGLDSIPFNLGRYSKYCDFFIKYNDEIHLLEILSMMGTYFKAKIPILVASDSLVIFMEKYKNTLSEFYLFYWQSKVKLEDLMDKHKMMQFAVDAGLDVPVTLCSSTTPLHIIENSIRFPSVIKPLYTRDTIKLLVVNSRDDFKVAITNSLFSHGYIVQEMVQGPENNIYLSGTYSDDNGNVVASACGRKLRQFPKNFGIASFAISDQNDIVRRLSEKFTQHLKYYGPADIEFKKSAADGRYLFIEINPRFPGFNQLFISSGCHLAYISYLGLKKSLNPEIKSTPSKNSIRYMAILADFFTCYKWYHDISIFSWFKDFARSNSFAMFSIRDLTPFFVYILNTIAIKIFQHLSK